jgi:surface-anchored protein
MGLRGKRSTVGVVAAIAAASATGASAQAAPVVLADGHVDYAARMVGGVLRSQIKDGTQGADRVVWREPADVVFELRAAAKTTVPADARLRFLGGAGAATWTIPQVQRQGILWAGWNTEELSAADVSGPLRWTLTSVQGPGTVAVFQTGSFGDPDVFFNSGDGLPDSRTVPLGTHAHGNWAFSAPGSYQLAFAMTATRPGGQTTSDTQTLNVLVDGTASAPPDPSPTPPAGPGQTPSTPNGPSAPAPQPTRPSPPAGRSGDTALMLRASRPRVRGRTLSFNARISRKSRLDVTVRRSGRVVARARAGTVTGSKKQRTVRVRLSHALAAGRRYTVTIRVRAAGRSVTRALQLRAPGTR